MKSIAQLAIEMGKTRKELKLKMREKPLSDLLPPCIHLKDGVRYVDEVGENYIKSVFENRRSSVDGNLIVYSDIEYGGIFKDMFEK